MIDLVTLRAYDLELPSEPEGDGAANDLDDDRVVNLMVGARNCLLRPWYTGSVSAVSECRARVATPGPARAKRPARDWLTTVVIVVLRPLFHVA